ncbi:hypothetical protein BACOV975_03949 [Bacteroides ovatus V975]|nr:hypothetical protein BACOV975_03949 [Bacteroides ovatus V975]
MEQQIQLNDHNKQEYPPMHTAEHLLNATMVKTFGCPRSRNAHIERKKANVTIYFRHVRQRNKSSLLKIE